MLRLIILLSFVINPLLLYAQHPADVAGRWTGSINVTGQQLVINFVFSFDDGFLDGTIDIPQQAAYNLPVEFTYADEDSLIFQFQTGTGAAVFKGKLNDTRDEIAGEFEQIGTRFPFSIARETAASVSQSDSTGTGLIIPTGAGQISGTLLEGEAQKPMVILLTGSGSQDRDENVAGFRVFGELAETLQDSGYSSFRYDDRGVGESEGPEDATLQDLSGDLKDIVDFLNENHNELFNGIVLLGHSQGGLVATLAAANISDLAGIIFMASPFLSGDEIINQQIRAISGVQGVNESIVEQNLVFQSRIYEVVRSRGDWEEIEQDLYERLEEQINTLPEQQRAALGNMDSFIRSQISRQLAAAKTEWFRSFIEFEPAELIGSLEIPMLAVFGEKDMQVLAAPNREAAENLSQSENLSLESVTIPAANHLFQKANTGMPGEYGMLEKRFADGFIEAIVEWLDNL
jgi:uncharacterized protein